MFGRIKKVLLHHTISESSSLTSVEKSFLFQIDNKPIGYVPAQCWYYEYGMDTDREIKKLLAEGYLEVSFITDINKYTIQDLKNVLRIKHLRLSGKKSDLVKRTLDNFQPQELAELLFKNQVYAVSSKGKPLIAGITYSATKDLEFEDKCISLILRGNYDSAYRAIAKHHAEVPGTFGLGIDWEYKSESGLNASDSRMYLSLMNQAKDNADKLIRACLIFSDIYGLSFSNSFLIAKRILNSTTLQKDFLDSQFDVGEDIESTFAKAQYDLWALHELSNIQSYQTMGLKEYEYLATLDCRTCAVCGALDGKKFKVSDAKTGVNLPPMHIGCRCTTAPVLPGAAESDSHIARDPETGKNYMVPAGMNYKKWHKIIDKEYGPDSLEMSRMYYQKHKKWKRQDK